MSDTVKPGRSGTRLYLLTSVSSITLLATAFGTNPAIAGSQPALWVEFGAQSDQLAGTADRFELPFDGAIPANGITGPLNAGPDLASGFSGEGKLTFRPGGADWVFTASVTYGRSTGKGKISQREPLPTTAFATYQTSVVGLSFPYFNKHLKPAQLTANTISGETASSESHTILDFSAGKDVGLGMFGSGSTSVFSAGVRFANFTSRLDVTGVEGALDNDFKKSYNTTHPVSYWSWFHTKASETWRTVSGSAKMSHTFKGIGPSLSWDASVPLLGQDERRGVATLDWGINAALLFGKQKIKEQHQSASAYNCYGPICNAQHVQYAAQSGHSSRSRNVTVPNLGGFVGASYRAGGFKASIGYRADWFFGVFDSGLGASHKADRGYFGPFASIGVGL